MSSTAVQTPDLIGFFGTLIPSAALISPTRYFSEHPAIATSVINAYESFASENPTLSLPSLSLTEGIATASLANAPAITTTAIITSIRTVNGVPTTIRSSRIPESSGDSAGASSNSPGTSGSDGGLSTGAKAGIGAGVGLGALIVVAVLIFLCLKRRKQNKRSRSGPPKSSEMNGMPHQGPSQAYQTQRPYESHMTQPDPRYYSPQQQQYQPYTGSHAGVVNSEQYPSHPTYSPAMIQPSELPGEPRMRNTHELP